MTGTCDKKVKKKTLSPLKLQLDFVDFSLDLVGLSNKTIAFFFYGVDHFFPRNVFFGFKSSWTSVGSKLRMLHQRCQRCSKGHPDLRFGDDSKTRVFLSKKDPLSAIAE